MIWPKVDPVRLEDVPADHEVRIEHFRAYLGTENCFPRWFEKDEWFRSWGLSKPKGKGGVTVAYVRLPDGRTVFGTARCSDKDNFCRKTGRELALGRALHLCEEA